MNEDRLKVRRIHTEAGSRIEPPYDPKWSKWERLEWEAAVVEADTGLRVDVLAVGPDEDAYQLTIHGRDYHKVISAHRYNDALRYIHGVGRGAAMMRTFYEAEEKKTDE